MSELQKLLAGNVPDEVKRLEQWVGWKAARLPDGKVDKIPVDVKTGAAASSTQPASWCTFAAALKALEEDDRLAGVGLVVTADDPYVWIDLDDCIDERGSISPRAAEWIKRFNSYSEFSPGGRGVHVLLKGQKPVRECVARGALESAGAARAEVYDRARFLTVTGRPLPGSPSSVEFRQAELDAFCAAVFSRSTQAGKAGGGFTLEGLTDSIRRQLEAGRGAGFDAMKLEQLLETSRKFKVTWLRRRPELKNDASRYDQAVAWHGVSFGLAIDEVVQLIVDHRTKHGDDPKDKRSRPDYLARTVKFAIEHQVSEEEAVQEHLFRSASDGAESGDRQVALNQLRELTTIPDLAGVVQIGTDSADYYLVRSDGQKAKVGNAASIRDQSKFWVTVYDHFDVSMPRLNPAKWQRATKLIKLLAVKVEHDDSTARAEALAWIRGYLDSTTVHGDRRVAAAVHEPYLVEAGGDDPKKELGLKAESLHRYVKLHLMESLTQRQVKRSLRFLGFCCERVHAVIDGRSTTRSYYVHADWDDQSSTPQGNDQAKQVQKPLF